MTASNVRRPTIVVAPDKFKGSATAAEVAVALARGLRTSLHVATVIELPTADGGEGTVDMLLKHGFAPVRREVTGPLGRPTTATYAQRGTTAVIEMAAASGLSVLGCRASRQTVMQASSVGVGELILDALERGHTRIVVTAGGSATTDGAAGALTALGLRLTSVAGEAVPAGGEGLLAVECIDTALLDPRLERVELLVACDVDSPLTGPTGAAKMFAPQKGATEVETATLERALQRWADAVGEATGTDLRTHPGVGAAGGLAFGLAAVLGARIVPASEFLLELVGFYDVARGADLVIVGEGSLDEQSLRGKGPVGIARALQHAGPTVIAVAGRCRLEPDALSAEGIKRAYQLVDLEPDEERCLANAAELLENTGAQIGAAEFPSATSLAGSREH